jgi:hypothetical protein
MFANLKIVLLWIVILQCLSPRQSFALDIVKDGKPLAVVVLSANPAKEEQQAAEEIRDYVRRISGAQVEVVRSGQDTAGRKRILIGAAAPASLESAVRAKDQDPASFALHVDKDVVSIRGLSPGGTLIGAYELLEQLGVRWFMPGDLGTVVPSATSISVKAQETIQVPSFASRWHSGSRNAPWLAAWQTHVRMGGPRFPSSHGINLGRDATFEKHPEYYALVKGKRSPRQLCVSNPNVIKLVAAQLQNGWNGMGPSDGTYGFCECPNCRALDAGDFDPYVSTPSLTDRYIWFFNRVLEAASLLGRDLKSRPNSEGPWIGFYAYDNYMRPPVREKPNSHIAPALAPITLCRIHGVNNPVCPEKSYYLTLVKQWRELCPVVYDRGYWFNLADIGLPFSMVHRLREEIPAERNLRVAGFRIETSAGSECHWASETPSLYIAARLMWNADADVDSLLMDFYEKFFGPAAKPMQGYFETMDMAVRNADYHTGSMYDMPHIYTADVREKALAYLADAKRLAGTGVYAKRVDLFQFDFDYLQAFVQMTGHATSFDFANAAKDVEHVRAIMHKLQSYNPPMVANNKFPERFLESFCVRYIEEGLDKTTNSGEMVASLADEWEFFQDTGNVGLDIGLWKPGCGGNWRTIKAYTQSWSDQGLRYYHGAAWYRQTVVVPAKFDGRRVILWLGGTTEGNVRVWVNGTELKRMSSGKRQSAEYDATDALPGRGSRRAAVVIRVVNDSVDELGVGGITAPVMLYSPRAGN